VGLIASPRHTAADLAHWARLETYDRRLAQSPRLADKGARAARYIAAFLADGPAYLGTSWGKDSVVLASIAVIYGIDVPMVWTRWPPVDNPDCPLVRSAFGERFPSADLCETAEPQHWDATKREWIPDDGAAGDFSRTAAAFGSRRITGIRADESKVRELRLARWGISSANTCAPLSRWTALDVFAWLALHDLPIHPAYACTFGGALDRGRVRVDALTGATGRGRGREDWESRYYGDELAALDGLKAQ